MFVISNLLNVAVLRHTCLRILVKGHTDTDERPYVCHICTRAFLTSNDLIVHLQRHPHECDVCHKQFAGSSRLKTHLLTHTGGER